MGLGVERAGKTRSQTRQGERPCHGKNAAPYGVENPEKNAGALAVQVRRRISRNTAQTAAPITRYGAL